MAATQDELRALYEATAAKLQEVEAKMLAQETALQTFLSAHGGDLESRFQNFAIELQTTKDVITGTQKNVGDLEARFARVDANLQSWVTASVASAMSQADLTPA